MPIELRADKLDEKSTQMKHPYPAQAILGLPIALQNPIAVFSYGDSTKALNVILELSYKGENFLAGVHFNEGKAGRLEIGSIRTIFPKKTPEWLNWIQQGKATYLNKESLLDLVAQQQMTLADVSYLDPKGLINIINGFENPNIASESDAQQRTNLAEVDSHTPDTSSNLANDADNVNSERAQIIQQAKIKGAWMKAPNGKPTNLNEDQWVTVRTKAFMDWFGDWASLAARNLIEMMSPIRVEDNPIFEASGTKQAVALARNYYDRLKENGATTRDGRSIQFGGRGFKETAQHAQDRRVIDVIPDLDRLISEAYQAFSLPYIGSDPNIKAFHHYMVKADFPTGEAYVRLLIREQAGGDFYYDNHLTNVAEIKKAPTSQPYSRITKSGTPLGSLGASMIKLINWWHNVNPEQVTVPLDENGEPNLSDTEFQQKSREWLRSIGLQLPKEGNHHGKSKLRTYADIAKSTIADTAQYTDDGKAQARQKIGNERKFIRTICYKINHRPRKKLVLPNFA